MSSPTRYVVSGAIAIGLLVAAYVVFGPIWGLVVIGAGIYEAWTLVNRWPHDTISEIVWELAERPLVPFMFGIVTGWMFTTGIFSNPFATLSWGFLMGHFFWQRFGK
jgi:hypothetical protein